MSATVPTCVAAALLAGLLAGPPATAFASDELGALSTHRVGDVSPSEHPVTDDSMQELGLNPVITAQAETETEASAEGIAEALIVVEAENDSDAHDMAEVDSGAEVVPGSGAPNIPVTIVPSDDGDQPLETVPPETTPPETTPPETIPPTTEPPITVPPVNPPVEVPGPGGAQEPQPPTDGTGNRQIIITTPVDIVQAPVLLAETAADPIGGWGAALAAVLASLSIAMGAALLGCQRRGWARVAVSAE